MRILSWFILLFLPLLALAQSPAQLPAQSPAQSNKQLFDRTVDELNFRTMETVYDRHFTRQKFPANLRTAAARRQFSGFENNTDLQKAFLAYNDVAERYKARFGKGLLTQAEFDKQLNSVLLDRNFEFFIRGLSRDERTALVRAEQRVLKQALAQFNASGAALATTAAANTEAEPPLTAAVPLTTHGPEPAAAEEAATEATGSANADGRPPTASQPAGGGPGWVGYGTLLFSLGSFALLLYLTSNLLAETRRLRNRVRALEADVAYYSAAPETDESAANEPPAAPAPGFFSRFRASASTELPDDKYGDEPA